MSFFSFLEKRTKSVDSLLCVGLDPHVHLLSAPRAEAAYDFCMWLIENTIDYAAAYKPNIAFFEYFGAEGISILKQVVEAIPEGIPIILDAKRGDISSTAQAYAHFAFQVINADAITVNPFLGYDSVVPFIQNPEHGVFLLCKTSNPGASDIQDKIIFEREKTSEKLTIYEHVARLAKKWDQSSNIGLVVGSTQPGALSRVREIAPEMWFLAPGVGAQGADLEEALQAGLRKDKSGVLINASRSISTAKNPNEAACNLRETINKIRQRYLLLDEIRSKDESKFKLADMLLETGCVKFSEEDCPFILKSGLKSPIYIDLRRLISFPELINQVAGMYLPILNNLEFDRLAALPYAAIPIATAVCLAGNWPMIYPRKEIKPYGTRAEIEGEYFRNEKVVVIDDLATTGDSKFEAIEKLTDVGLQVKDIVVLIDRQSGAAEAMASAGYQLHAVFNLSEMLDHWSDKGYLTNSQITSVREFLNSDRC